MAAIQLKNKHETHKCVNLSTGAITIGRANDNNLTFSDQTMSAYHARIFTYLDASYIEDLNSTNGTFINGKRIIKHTLHAGDVIKMGQYQFEISPDNEISRQAQ